MSSPEFKGNRHWLLNEQTSEKLFLCLCCSNHLIYSSVPHLFFIYSSLFCCRSLRSRPLNTKICLKVSSHLLLGHNRSSVNDPKTPKLSHQSPSTISLPSSSPTGLFFLLPIVKASHRFMHSQDNLCVALCAGPLLDWVNLGRFCSLFQSEAQVTLHILTEQI